MTSKARDGKFGGRMRFRIGGTRSQPVTASSAGDLNAGATKRALAPIAISLTNSRRFPVPFILILDFGQRSVSSTPSHRDHRENHNYALFSFLTTQLRCGWAHVPHEFP